MEGSLDEDEPDPRHKEDGVGGHHQDEDLGGATDLAEQEGGEGPGGEDHVLDDHHEHEDLTERVHDDREVEDGAVPEVPPDQEDEDDGREEHGEEAGGEQDPGDEAVRVDDPAGVVRGGVGGEEDVEEDVVWGGVPGEGFVGQRWGYGVRGPQEEGWLFFFSK